MKLEGAVLLAAKECAARPAKKRPEYWATMVRIAPLDDKHAVLESTNGRVLMRLTLEHEQKSERFIPHRILKRLRPADVVEIEDFELDVEEASIHADLAIEPAPSLANAETGEKLRVWPDFDLVIPKGARKQGRLIGLRADVVNFVMRASRHLSTNAQPLELVMETGGPTEPVKLSGKSIYGDVVFCVMPWFDGVAVETKKSEDATNAEKALSMIQDAVALLYGKKKPEEKAAAEEPAPAAAA